MTKENLHISEENFKRYLENEMTSQERNTFEKELQKNAFEAEAIEGFEAVSSTNFANDINELKTKINHPEKRKSYRWLAVAASILLIITAGVIWTQLNTQIPVQEMAENKKIDKEEVVEEKKVIIQETPEINKESESPEEKAASEMERRKQTKPIQEKQEANKKSLLSAENMKIESRDDAISTVQERAQQMNYGKAKPKIDTNKYEIAGIQKTTIKNEDYALSNRVIRGKVFSADDNQPLPGVSLVVKNSTYGTVTDIDGNFKLQLQDSNSTIIASFIGMESNEFQPKNKQNYLIKMKPDDEGLDEVVVVGYGIQKKKTVVGAVSKVESTTVNPSPKKPVIGTEEYKILRDESTSPKDSPAKPAVGIKTYNNYLDSVAILSNEHQNRKEVVKLLLHLNSDGEIFSIENKNKASSELFERAKKIVKEGPAWNPETKDGIKLVSEVDLKIVFRKE